jgi:DNA polymerase-3 subunit alpha
MLEVFHDVPQAVSNTVEVAERCDFVLQTGNLQLPEFRVPAGESFDSYLARLAWRGLAERLSGDPDAPLPRGSDEYASRLEYELDVIKRCGYSGYFLIVWDFIRFARERDIPVGPGRGSSAGSLVAWALQITGIDPLEYRIPFERFLNPERVSMPDIDVDFCMNRRSEVIRYLEERYNGEGDQGRRVAGIVTFGTMQAKAALRDVGRVLGIPFADVDRIAKLVPNTLGITLAEALQHSRELRELVEGDARYKEVFELAKHLEGQIRHPGKHAAGVVISSGPLIETAPLYRDSRTKEIVTQFDYRCAEKVGLLKFDLLGLRTLTIVRDAERRIAETCDPDFSIEKAPLDDVATYDLLCKGDTEGIFQVGQSTGMSDLVVKFQPRRFSDLIALVAIYRPGPLQSGMVDDFVERRHGRGKVEYLLPELEEILAETHGVIVYQDQVLQIANRLASFSLGEGDLLRRAMGKKIHSEMEKQRERFLEGCRKNGHPEQKASEIFNLMYQFAGYGFPKAHSAAYALLTQQTAYLKAHYPAEFLAAVMTAEWRDHDRLVRYVRDAASHGIEIQPPSVNQSEAGFTVVRDGERKGIRFGLVAIKNVGEGAVEAILQARREAGPFRSLFELCERVDSRRVNRRVLESLIRCGAFDFQKATRASLWTACPAALERGAQAEADRASGQESLFGDLPAAREPALQEIAEWEPSERLRAEKELLGLYVTGHPLMEHAETLERLRTLRSDRIDEGFRSRRIRMGGMLSGLTTAKTRRGGLMARAVLEDLHGAIDVVIFPQVFEEHAATLRAGVPVLVRGMLQLESDRAELHLDDVVQLAEGWERWTTALRLRLDERTAARKHLDELRAILDLVPGEVPVSVHLRLSSGAEAVFQLPRHRVAVNAELVRSVDRLFGRSVTECVIDEG